MISECNLPIPLTAEQTLLKAMKIKLRRPCTAFTTPIRSKQDVNCPLKHDNATARRFVLLALHSAVQRALKLGWLNGPDENIHLANMLYK